MDSDTDDILASLEKEGDTDDYRSQRLEELQSEFSSHQQHHATDGQKQEPLRDEEQQELSQRGATTQPQAVTTLLNNSEAVPTLPNDQSVLDFTTQIPHSAVHFFHPDFSRCATMDNHISALAGVHNEGSDGRPVRFARADVRDVPFVVEKLKIRVLPCVLAFRDGVVVDRVLGFEGLGSGGVDAEKTFSTASLEDRFVDCGVLDVRRVARGEGAGDEDDSSADEDEDEEEEGDGYPRRRKAIRSGGVRPMGRNDDDDEDDDWD